MGLSLPKPFSAHALQKCGWLFLAGLSVQTAVHPVDPAASHRYDRQFHAHSWYMKPKAQASGLLQPRHRTQATRFSHEHAFNPLPFSRRPQEHRPKEQVEIPLGLSSLRPAHVLGEVCVRRVFGLLSEVEAARRALRCPRALAPVTHTGILHTS